MSNFLDNPRSSRPPKKRSFMRPRTRIRRNGGQNNNDNGENGGNSRNGNGNDNNRNGNGNGGSADNDPPSTDYAFQAVACADAADPGNVTTKMVFDSIVDSARTASPICNEADPSTPFLSAKSVADALGDSAILIEQDDFGTNQVLFPGPGITKNTLSVLAASEASDSAGLKAELDEARAYGRDMTVAVIVLACTAALLLVALVVSSIHERKVRAPAQVRYVAPEALEKAVLGRA
ncbi:hypothetical protein FRC06_010943 [Ceratobasidium sp. 370]|nr:hypothetical protein FRC06_010943 [Ceratobasidium sp. 370]